MSFCAVEEETPVVISKALIGEVMIPYDTSKGMTSKEIVEKYHVTKKSANYRVRQDKKK